MTGNFRWNIRTRAHGLRLFGSQLPGGTTPDVLARTIYEAVREGATKLRYAVGVDAEVIIAARDRRTAGE